jgi:predicted permease
MGRFLRLVRRHRLDRELSRELAAHLDLIADDLIARGIPREEAYRRARIQLGGVAQVTEASREARGTRVLEELLRDLRLTFRGLRRSPVFTVAAVLTLGLGVGANTAVWNVLDALLFRSLPVPRSDELRVLRSGEQSDEDPNYLFSFPKMQRFQARLPDSVQLAAMSSVDRIYLTAGAQPMPVETQLVSGNWFSLLGVGAIQGRPLNPSDDQEGAPPVIVLSDGFWRRRFGADSNVVGQTVRLNGAPLTVAGVIEEGFNGLTIGNPVDVWVPLHLQPTIRYAGNSFSTDSDTEKPWLGQNGINWLTLSLRAGTGLAPQVQAALAPLHRANLEEEYAGLDSAQRARRIKPLALEPLARGFSVLRSQFGDPVKVLMVSVCLVFLICCANLASLLLARSSAREQELAVRASLGAGSRRLFRQALTESLTLGVLGGLVSIPIAWWGGLALLRAASPVSRPIPLPVVLDWRGLGFALLLSLLAGILLGLGPAVRAARAAPLTGSGGSRATTRALHRLPWGRLLVVSQIALSLALVTGAGLFVRSLRNFLEIDTGYERANLIEARIDTRAAGYRYDELPALYQRMLDEVGAVPGVRAVGLALNGLAGGATRISGFQVPGITRAPDWNGQGQENYVSAGWFRAVGLPILRGREFLPQDRADGPRVAVVTQEFARHFFGTEDVVGRRFGYSQPRMEVIGVARDARVNALKQRPRRLVYFPLAQGPEEYIQSIEFSVVGSPEEVAGAVRAALARSEPLLPVREVVPVGDLLERGLSREKLLARLAGAFSGLALLLAAVGLYGVLAYSVSRRTTEIGVRIALGASPSSVWRLILRECTGIVVVGIIIGLILWIPAHRLLKTLVYGLSSFDPGTLTFAGLLLLVVALLAGSIPASRAARVDPARTLRNQ